MSSTEFGVGIVLLCLSVLAAAVFGSDREVDASSRGGAVAQTDAGSAELAAPEPASP